MAHLQVVDEGSASNMVGSCEYIEKRSRGQPTRGGLPAWGLGEMLTTPRRKTYQVIKISQRKSRTSGAFDCGNEHSGSIKCGEYLE